MLKHSNAVLIAVLFGVSAASVSGALFADSKPGHIGAPSISDMELMAKVGHVEITRADLMSRPSALAGKSEDKRAALERAIERALLAAEAEAIGLDRDPEVKHVLQRSRTELLANALTAKVLLAKQQQAKVDDQDINDYFERHPDEFRRIASVSLRVLAITRRGDQSDDGKSAALNDARLTAVTKALESGKTFAEVAAAYTDLHAGHMANGARVDVDPKMLPPQLRTLAETAKVGEMAGPVTTPTGQLYVFVEARAPAVLPKLAEIRNEVRGRVVATQNETIRRDYLDELRRKHKVEYEYVTSR